jgi:hypothetical protein
LALALQQHRQQSALRKGRSWGHNIVFAVFHDAPVSFVMPLLFTSENFAGHGKKVYERPPV